MKKLLTLILALGLTALVGCGTAGKTESDVKDTGSKTETASSESSLNFSDDIKAGEVKLCDYKNITLDWNNTANNQILNNALANYTASTKEITDRAVQNGDIANIDFAGYKNGVAFDGGTSEGYDLEIGSGSFIPGFEEGLVGVKPGESVNLDLTFPENYGSADLAGQDVVFKVTVNYIKEETFAEEDIKSAKDSVFGQALFNHVLTNSTYGELDKELTDFYTPRFRDMYESQIKSSYGYESIEAYLQATGSSEDDFNTMIAENVKYRVMYDTVANAIAEKENIKVTDAEYKKSLEQYAESAGITAEEFETANGKVLIKAELLTEKVMAFLEEKSTLK